MSFLGNVSLKRLLASLFLFLLSVWFIFSCARTVYNITKLYSEEASWVVLGDTDKRVRIFGDLYRVVSYISANTNQNSNLLFLSPGGKTYYLSRYYLYPRKITYVKNTSEMRRNLEAGMFDYLVVFQTSERGLNEYDSLSWKIDSVPDFTFLDFDNKAAVLKIYNL